MLLYILQSVQKIQSSTDKWTSNGSMKICPLMQTLCLPHVQTMNTLNETMNTQKCISIQLCAAVQYCRRLTSHNSIEKLQKRAPHPRANSSHFVHFQGLLEMFSE